MIKKHFLSILRWGLRLHGSAHLIEVVSAISEGAYITASIAFVFIFIETIENEVPLMQEGKFKHDFVWEAKKRRGRYIKVSAKNVGKLPEKHPAAGSDAWIFIDEIIIN